MKKSSKVNQSTMQIITVFIRHMGEQLIARAHMACFRSPVLSGKGGGGWVGVAG